MPVIHLVLADHDLEYVNHLSQWFIENKQHQFKIAAFSEKESLKKYISENNQNINVLLAAEDFLFDIASYNFIPVVLGQAVKLSNLSAIDKYKPAPSICGEIMSILTGGETESKWYNTGKSDLVVCYSVNIYLKSTIALMLSLLSDNYIYINLDSFPIYLVDGRIRSYGRNLSDVLYHIKSRKGNPVMALESSVATGGNQINHIPPIDNPTDLWELTDDEIDIFIEALKTWGRFSKVITDHECNAGPLTIKLFEAASCIIIPFDTTNLHQLSRINSMINGIHGLNCDKIRWVFCGNSDGSVLPRELDGCYEIRWINGSIPVLDGFTLDSYKRSQLEGLLSD